MKPVQGNAEGGNILHEGRNGKGQASLELMVIPCQTSGGRIFNCLTVFGDNELKLLTNTTARE